MKIFSAPFLSNSSHFIAFFLLLTLQDFTFSSSSPRIIHVFVALCDNEHQGIVPVPARLGNGEDPDNNLYWGAAYGVKTFLNKSSDWKLVATIKRPANTVMERCVFRHRAQDVYLIADAYDGINIREAIVDFLKAAAGGTRENVSIALKPENLALAGLPDLVVYVGHDGLMDFQLSNSPERQSDQKRDAAVLACASEAYFSDTIRKTGARPLLWTTGLMAPEAYVLKAMIDGWILNETGDSIRMRSAKAYDLYQKCGLKAAMRLFKTGW